MVSKELTIIYDTPSMTHIHIMGTHNLAYYLKFFDKLHILYWSKEEVPEVFEKENGKFIFYPYLKPYNSGYITGIKFMAWIGKTLWKICQNTSKETKLIFMPVIPIWAGIPTLIVSKLRRKKIVLRLEHPKIEGLKIEDETWGVPKIFITIKVLILKIIYFLTIPLYDYVIGISNYVLNEAKRYRAKKAILIPMLVDIVRFQPKHFKNNKEILILSVGQIKKRKGFGELIEALRFLKKEDGITPKLLIIGGVTNPNDKIFLQEFQNMAKGLNAEFRGEIRHDELAKIYNQADIFVLASYLEGLGIAIMEAMASGLPVITTGNSGSKDLVEDGENGFLVPVKDPVAIREKIKILLKNPNLRESMGIKGRERIEELMKKVDENNKKLWEQKIL